MCRERSLTQFLSLGDQPLANSFITSEQLEGPEPVFPLDVYFCSSCGLVQLVDIVDKRTLFSNYVYFSSGMPKLSKHFQDYSRDLVQRFLHGTSQLVVEIGSNDGLFLKALQSAGIPVLGVDPAKNIASVANASGIPTINEFFSAELGREIRRRYGPATAIVGNNVVAHIDDHHDLAAGVAELLTDDGIFVFEAPYLGDMFENISYDTIYHEHLSYLSLRPLVRLFDHYGLDVFDVQFFPVQGRSMRTFVGRKGAHMRLPTVDRVAEDELARGFHQFAAYHSLATRIAESRDRLLTVLRSFKELGKSLAGYGAPAKGNTMLNYCGIGTDLLDYLIDDLPSKQGMFAPGTHLPVRQRAYLDTHPVDVLLMLAWNYQDSILERERGFRERGGRFVIPVRGVEVA